MKEQNQLTLRPEQPLAVSRTEPDIGDMLKAVIDRGVTAENVNALKELTGLYERMQAKDSEKAFNMAFVALQSEMPTIVAQSAVPNRGKYEKLEDILERIGPLLRKHGFSASFEQHAEANRITVICHLRHLMGHSTQTPYSVRAGGKSDSETQADVKAGTTAARKALQLALNIVIRQDCLSEEETDASMMGSGNVTPDQAFELERRVKETNADRAKFLEYAGQVKSFKDIPASRYDDCDAMLTRKERAR